MLISPDQLNPAYYLWNILTVLLGLIIGSFVNVVVARLPHAKSLKELAFPPSHCPKCKATIRWYDNIPVLSYLILRGQCRSCHERISIRYPLIEIIVATLFLATKMRFGWGPLLWFRDWPFVATLVAITFIDLEHRIIPNELSLGGLVLGLATCNWVPGLGLWQGFAGAAIGYGFFYLLAWAYYYFRGRSGLGGGDVKLLAMLGAFLGPMGIFVTVFVSSVTGSLIGIVWAVARRRKRKKSLMTLAIPYGPFLVIGGLYYYLLGDLLWLPFMTQI